MVFEAALQRAAFCDVLEETLAECSKLRRAIWIECQPKKWDIAYARQHGIKVLANIGAALAE